MPVRLVRKLPVSNIALAKPVLIFIPMMLPSSCWNQRDAGSYREHGAGLHNLRRTEPRDGQEHACIAGRDGAGYEERTVDRLGRVEREHRLTGEVVHHRNTVVGVGPHRPRCRGVGCGLANGNRQIRRGHTRGRHKVVLEHAHVPCADRHGAVATEQPNQMVDRHLGQQVVFSELEDLAAWRQDLAVVFEASAEYAHGFNISPIKKSDAASGLGRSLPRSVVTTSWLPLWSSTPDAPLAASTGANVSRLTSLAELPSVIACPYLVIHAPRPSGSCTAVPLYAGNSSTTFCVIPSVSTFV